MKKDIIVIGASAGGVGALKQLVAGLPPDLEAAVFIVMHVGSSERSHLPQILQRCTSVPIDVAKDGEPIRPGRISVARPDYHLLVDAHAVRLTRGPRENRSRPAIDALFRSAALAFGPRVIGVVLTGSLDDGSAGLWWVKDRGGTAVVQDPGDAEFPAMPENALSQVAVDYVVPLEDVAALLGRLTHEEAGPKGGPAPKVLDVQVQIASEGRGLQAGIMTLGPITPYTCPECHGALVQIEEGGVPHFRCHTGHGYSINTLLADVTEYVEQSLWGSIRAIEESAMLLQQLAHHARDHVKDGAAASLLDAKAADTLKRADVLRKVTNEHQTLSRDNVTEVATGAR